MCVQMHKAKIKGSFCDVYIKVFRAVLQHEGSRERAGSEGIMQVTPHPNFRLKKYQNNIMKQGKNRGRRKKKKNIYIFV